MTAALLSTIAHLATRLQSAGMIHVANTRDFLPGDSADELAREAAAIAKLAEQLSFEVGRLQASVASSAARPRLDQHITLPARATRPEAERFDMVISDSEGGEV